MASDVPSHTRHAPRSNTRAARSGPSEPTASGEHGIQLECAALDAQGKRHELAVAEEWEVVEPRALGACGKRLVGRQGLTHVKRLEVYVAKPERVTVKIDGREGFDYPLPVIVRELGGDRPRGDSGAGKGRKHQEQCSQTT